MDYADYHLTIYYWAAFIRRIERSNQLEVIGAYLADSLVAQYRRLSVCDEVMKEDDIWWTVKELDSVLLVRHATTSL